MENTENSLYALLIGISKDVGEIKSDVKNVQMNVESYNADSIKADEKVANKLEEYVDFIQKKQESIKSELDMRIGNSRAEFAEELKKTNKEVEAVKERVKTLEEKPKNTLWGMFEKFKGVLIAAMISALVGFCVRVVCDLVKTVNISQQIKYERVR